MSDKSRVLCKYHVSGVCRFGSECAFSHDLADLPNQVCKFYLAGCCAYGDRCRYDHKRPDWWKAAKAAAARAEQQSQQQSRPARRAIAAQYGEPSAASGSGGGGTSHAATRVDAWGAEGPHDRLVRLPRSLSGDGAGGGGGGAGDAAAACASSRRDDGCVEESWEDAAGAYAGEADAAAQYDEDDDAEYEYDGDDNGGHYAEDGQQLEHDNDDDGGGGWDEDGGWEEENDVDGGGGNGGGGGLVMVDDDVGLEQERAAALQGGPVELAAAAASRWAAAQHPWEAGGSGTAEDGTADPLDPAEVELCPGFALRGRCADGEDCPLIHGLECETCHKFRIHPYNTEAADEHRATCRLRHERLEARLRSSGVECGICLEPVLDKPSVSERRFGLLACDHAFCLACIRSWRGRTDDASLATDTAVRTCPICRTPSHFVTPSLVWPASGEEKAAIVSAYKERLAGIDCKQFDFGDGSCPFSTSCFYRHMYRDGRMEEPVLRRAGNADGDVRVLLPMRLSAFFDTPQAQRLLRPGRRY